MKQIFAALLLLFAVVGCSHKANKSDPDVRLLPTMSVRGKQLEQREKVIVSTYAGTFVPLRSAKLATRLSGWITQLQVEEGDYVEKGRPLVKIDAQELTAQVTQADAGVAQAEAQLRQAQASVAASSAGISEAQSALATARATLPQASAQRELAATEFRKMELLYHSGAIPQLDYDRYRTNLEVADANVSQLRSQVDQAEAALLRARSSTSVAQAAVGSAKAGTLQAQAGQEASLVPLQYATISSPIDGYVVKKSAYLGEMAVPGQTLLEIQDTKTLRLEVAVPESVLWQFEPNKAYRVKVDATQKEYVGRLEQIVPSGDPQSRTFLLKLSVPNPDGRLLPGMYAKLEVTEGKETHFFVPAEAVILRGEIAGVFTVTPDSKAAYQLVKLGERQGDEYEVLTGLNSKSTVIMNPPSDLKSGSPLELRPWNTPPQQ